jgi:hypothetical protein
MGKEEVCLNSGDKTKRKGGEGVKKEVKLRKSI